MRIDTTNQECNTAYYQKSSYQLMRYSLAPHPLSRKLEAFLTRLHF